MIEVGAVGGIDVVVESIVRDPGGRHRLVLVRIILPRFMDLEERVMLSPEKRGAVMIVWAREIQVVKLQDMGMMTIFRFCTGRCSFRLFSRQ
jgi:hypothetical protein